MKYLPPCQRGLLLKEKNLLSGESKFFSFKSSPSCISDKATGHAKAALMKLSPLHVEDQTVEVCPGTLSSGHPV